MNLRIGILPIIEHLPVVIAKNEVSYSGKTIKYDLDIYTSWTALEAAFRTKGVDAAAITLPKALLMAYEGVPLKIVLVLSRNGTALVLNDDSLESLKGKIIGCSGNDTTQLLIFKKFLKDKGLKSGYDTRSILIPIEKAISYLKEEKIYGFCLPEPYGVLAEEAKIAKKIILSKDISPNHISSVIIIQPEAIENKPGKLREWVKSIIKSAEFIEQDKKDSGCRQVAVAQTKILNIDTKIVIKSLQSPENRVNFNKLTPDISEIESIMKNTIEIGILPGTVNISKLIDNRYIEAEKK
ncbi:MAG: ABC transporter substrate-binding protein [Desulfobacterales bacterium]|nr:ABC transporter substrate-binding protein [Desulfobacterales bacterium]